MAHAQIHCHPEIKLKVHPKKNAQAVLEGMKMLSGWEVARCDEYQFRAKIKVQQS